MLKTNRWALEVMKSASIDGNDLKHVSMIEEYLKLKEEGHKTTFITTYLEDTYNLSERQIYRVIKRLTREVKL